MFTTNLLSDPLEPIQQSRKTHPLITPLTRARKPGLTATRTPAIPTISRATTSSAQPIANRVSPFIKIRCQFPFNPRLRVRLRVRLRPSAPRTPACAPAAPDRSRRARIRRDCRPSPSAPLRLRFLKQRRSSEAWGQADRSHPSRIADMFRDIRPLRKPQRIRPLIIYQQTLPLPLPLLLHHTKHRISTTPSLIPRSNRQNKRRCLDRKEHRNVTRLDRRAPFALIRSRERYRDWTASPIRMSIGYQRERERT